jgi:hypothetical protein
MFSSCFFETAQTNRCLVFACKIRPKWRILRLRTNPLIRPGLTFSPQALGGLRTPSRGTPGTGKRIQGKTWRDKFLGGFREQLATLSGDR